MLHIFISPQHKTTQSDCSFFFLHIWEDLLKAKQKQIWPPTPSYIALQTEPTLACNAKQHATKITPPPYKNFAFYYRPQLKHNKLISQLKMMRKTEGGGKNDAALTSFLSWW